MYTGHPPPRPWSKDCVDSLHSLPLRNLFFSMYAIQNFGRTGELKTGGQERKQEISLHVRSPDSGQGTTNLREAQNTHHTMRTNSAVAKAHNTLKSVFVVTKATGCPAHRSPLHLPHLLLVLLSVHTHHPAIDFHPQSPSFPSLVNHL